jgi:hypothetical protein
MLARLVPLLLLTHGSAASAATTVSMGLGAGVAADLGDKASDGNTRLGVGPGAVIPIRIAPLDFLRIRLDVRCEMGFGVDQLTWSETIDGVEVRRTDDDAHRAFVGNLSVETGLDVVIPTGGGTQPYLAGTIGVGMVGAYHVLDGGSAVLLDPGLNDLDDPRNIDPYTLQPALVAGVAAGLTIRASDKVDLWLETGYSAAVVGPRSLRKTAPELDARREAFAWNPIRAGLGFAVKL